MRALSCASGSDAHIPLERANAGIQETVDAALAQLDGKLDQLVH
jgi:hypothetical protein